MTETLSLAVFGDPVEHSRSPQIHALFGRQLGLAVAYRRIRSSIPELPDKVAEFRALGGIGANLTVPLKHAGLRQCQQLDQAARQARAVNTLHLKDGGWHGYNTDGAGLLLDLERLAINLNGARILIIGAGGATAGILGPLLAAAPSRICLLNRTPDKAVALAERFAHRGPIQAAGLQDGPPETGFDLLIQATSLGHDGGIPDIHPQWLVPGATIYDLNYGPAHQSLADWCQNHGFNCHDGLGMLVGQAALAFEIWTGRRPEMAPVLEELGNED